MGDLERGRTAGGFPAAPALRTVGEATESPWPVRFTGSATGAAPSGCVGVEVAKPFTGDRTAALRVSMTQSEAPTLEGSVWTAADEMPGYAAESASIPEYPGPEGLPSVTGLAGRSGRQGAIAPGIDA